MDFTIDGEEDLASMRARGGPWVEQELIQDLGE